MTGATPSDGEIVRRVLDGDREAFGLLVERYQDPLYRHALRMLDREDAAADAVQDALVRGYEKLDRCRDPARVGGWLFRITANLCRDRLRARREDRVALEDAPQSAGSVDPEDDLRRVELRSELEEALGALSAEKREAFVLKHLEELSYQEMARRTDASVSALKMRVHRAREELQELVARPSGRGTTDGEDADGTTGDGDR